MSSKACIAAALVLAAGLGGSPTKAIAQFWLSTPGALGTAKVSAGHASLTLPPGTWTDVSAITENPLQTGGAQSVDIDRKWLAQISDGQVAAMVYISSNITRSARGWIVDPMCARRDIVFFSNISEYPRTYDCMMVNHFINALGDNPSPFWVNTLEKLTSLGKPPHTMICAWWGMISSSRQDFIRVAVCMNPTLSGFADMPDTSWLASEWHKSRITPDRQAYIDKVALWAKAYHDTVANAFD